MHAVRQPEVRAEKPEIVTLDFESVLIPELWIAIAEHTGIEKLRLTTRDVADYRALMDMRITTLEEHSITRADIQDIVRSEGPLPGAAEFLERIRAMRQVVILSDTFYDFAQPLLWHFAWPTLFCHTLETDSRGMIIGYHLREGDKKAAVGAFQRLGFRVCAVGDSHNDLAMLNQADRSTFFNAPESLTAQYPGISAVYSYDDLYTFIRGE